MAKKSILVRSRLKKARSLIEANRLSEAGAVLEQVAKTERRDADTWLMLGVVAGRQGQHAKAADSFEKALNLKPGDIRILYNLGIALRDSGDFEQALAVFRELVELQPGFNDAESCLAHTCMALGRLEESIEAFRRALELQPGKPELHANLGSALQNRGLLEEAVASYKTALQINPGLPVYDSLGSALTGQGRFNEAVAAHREGLRRHPGDARAHSNLLLTLNYLPELAPGDVFKEHCRWGERHGNPPGRIKIYKNQQDADRRLRIGYVSPDFRTHSVACYIEPLLQRHDRNVVEVFCYSTVPKPDETTLRLREHADQWRDICGLTDEQVAAQVQADQIDILVDLAGHTARNRLTAFALRPAPVQVSWLGYPNTTGLPAIYYRLTDKQADPAGQENFYTEKLVRLPDCFLCYLPPVDAPLVSPLPYSKNGHITFGSFNNLAKITNEVIEVWCHIIESVPGSRLLLKNPGLTDMAVRQRFYDRFASHGIGENRVELIGHTPGRREHLDLYARIDIALDTFPYNGTATTCEALWMGVPVIALEGDRHAGRVGKSLLACLDMDDWVAVNKQEYVKLAVQHASNPGRLGDLREGMRERLAKSRLLDAKSFSANIENAYRKMWDDWCFTVAR